MIAERLNTAFRAKYGKKPRVFRAPGRINLIGEHTDYNDGLVLPAAIQFATYVAGSSRRDRRIRVASMSYETEFELDLDAPASQPEKTWLKYVQGIASILEREGYGLTGADILIDSDVPVGAGLSSSAAIEISTAFALASLSGHLVDGMTLAHIGQSAEYEFANVRCGIMDQFASVFGRANHALLLDCRSMEWAVIPASNAQFLICNTRTKHDLANGEYNKRRVECETAAAFFGRSSLRDVALTELDARFGDMPDILGRRARHIITENERVRTSVAALKASDLETFGSLMNMSHDSLRDDFEVSCDELDRMVELARSSGKVFGARMTGGGFGGCTINLMRPGDHREFIENIAEAYTRETGIVPDIYECEMSDGVCELTPT
jgi:galactokinase